MCEAGRIRHHLKNGIGDAKNTVFFVGFCAENTLGRNIRDGKHEVNIFGKRTKVRAAVEAIDSFSGHADHSELMDYFRATGGPKTEVWLVHGETEKSMALCEALRKEHDGDVSVGVLGETVEF
jgi:metallo-beta-lactamase family protein